MKTRGSRVLGALLTGGCLLFHATPAQATAIALSQILGSVSLNATGPAELVFLGSSTAAFAQAQNSLGELDAQYVDNGPAAALVTWANAAANGGIASSGVQIPGSTVGAASAVGQGFIPITFMVTCAEPPCSGDAQVNFSSDIFGQLDVMTDAYGVLAQTETIFNLILDGESLLFHHLLLSIGSNNAQSQSFAETLATSVNLQFGTEYSLLLRVDSESLAINTPEPATATLLSLGLAAALRSRMRRKTAARRTAIS